MDENKGITWDYVRLAYLVLEKKFLNKNIWLTLVCACSKILLCCTNQAKEALGHFQNMRATLFVLLLVITLALVTNIVAKESKRIYDHPSVVIPFGGSGIHLTADDGECFQWFVPVKIGRAHV